MRPAAASMLVLTFATATAWVIFGPAPAGATLVVLLAAGGAAWRPGATLALLVGLVPGIDLLLGMLHGRIVPGNAGRPTWVEPLALGVVLGLLVRRARRPAVERGGGAGRLLVAAVVASLVLALARAWSEWGEHLPAFMALAVRALPAHDATASEHLLRAALLLIAPVGWLILLGREPDEALFGARFWRCATAGPLIAGGLAMALSRFAPGGEPIFLDDKNADGSLLLLSLFGSLHLARRDPAPWGRRLAVLGALASVLLLLRTGSRSALLAGVFGALVVAGSHLAPRRAPRHLRVGYASLFVAVGVALLILGTMAVTSPRRVRDFAEYVEVNRLGVWSAAVRATASEPMLGLGPGQFFRLLGVFHGADPPPFTWLPPRENAHNQVLQVAAETGLLGAAGFLLLLGAALAGVWRARPPGDLPCLPVGATVYVLTLLISHPLLLSRQVLLFWTFLAAAGALRSGSAPGQAVGVRPTAGRAAWAAPWLAAAAGLVLSLPARPLPCASWHEVADGVRWDFAAGFYDEETGPEGTWQWMKDVGQIRFCNDSGRPVPLPGPFRAASFAGPRRLTLFPDAGEPLPVISETPLDLPLPEVILPPGGRSSLLLLPEPGAASIHRTLGTADHRRVSLRCSGPRRVMIAQDRP